MSTGGYWGELYLRSTAPLISADTTAREAAYLAKAFKSTAGPVLDVGCGHGRHTTLLNDGALKGRVVGAELDALSLRGATFPAVRADFRALPIRPGSLGGAYAWYSTLFIHDEGTHRRVLWDLAQSLRRGGLFVFHSVPYERLAASPDAGFEGALPDGSTVREQSHFDAKTGFDRGERHLTLPDGRMLSGAYTIRYYPLPELLTLLWAAGFTLRWAHGDLDGAPVGEESTDLIIGAERTHG